MYLLSGTLREKPQESHRWHGQKLNHNLINSIDLSQAVTVTGGDTSRRSQGGIPFHLPILGGWKNYILLEMTEECAHWHIGWIVRCNKNNQVTRFQLHKLPLYTNRVRMLTGTEDYTTTFFAVDAHGQQLPLQAIATGHIGDHQYPHVRLL